MIERISGTNMNRCTIGREAGTNMGMRFPDCKSFPDCKKEGEKNKGPAGQREAEIWKANGHENTPEKKRMGMRIHRKKLKRLRDGQ